MMAGKRMLNHKGVDVAVNFIYIIGIPTYQLPEYRKVQKIQHIGIRAF